MFKRELKVNLKSFVLWSVILMSIYALIFLLYPSIIASDSMSELDAMMEMFPPEILKAFNMDISSITTAFGWLKTEGFVFILLVTGCYSSILGTTILLKEESDKTIEYLACLPVTRRSIVLSKYAVGFLYTVGITVVIGVFNYVGLYLSGDFDVKQYLLLAVTPIFPSIVLFSICMFISGFFKKTGKMLGLSIGITFISYFLNVLSDMNESIEAVKYISIYTLADLRNVITDVKIDPVYVAVSIGISAVMLLLTVYRYEKKELV